MHYLTLTLTRFFQNLRISAKNGTKMHKSYKTRTCIVPLKEILKKVVPYQEKKDTKWVQKILNEFLVEITHRIFWEFLTNRYKFCKNVIRLL